MNIIEKTHKKLIYRPLLFFWIATCFSPTIAVQAKIIGKDVGDTTQGHWLYLSFQEGTCPIKGEPDEPFTDIISSRTTTQGRYRLVSWVRGPGETVFNTCEELSVSVYASCIHGFQEASALFSLDHAEESFADNENFYGCQLISESAYSCKFKHSGNSTFYQRKSLFCEQPYSFLEWHFYDNQVNAPVYERNLGQSCLPGQCCDI